MLMSRDGGVRQRHGENAPGGCNFNPLRLQKLLQNSEGVVSSPGVQIVVQHRGPGPWGLDGMGRRSGQTLGIP